MHGDVRNPVREPGSRRGDGMVRGPGRQSDNCRVPAAVAALSRASTPRRRRPVPRCADARKAYECAQVTRGGPHRAHETHVSRSVHRPARTARRHAATACRNTVDTVILRCPAAIPPGPTTEVGRARQACPRRRDAGGARRGGQPGGRGPPPPGRTEDEARPAIAPKSELAGRRVERASPAVPFIGRGGRAAGGPQARREVRPAPVARSPGARTVRRHAATACGNAAGAGILPG